MTNYSLNTPAKVARKLALSVRRMRLEKNWKQSTLAERSGVSLPSLRRFETKAEISLASFLKLVFSLDRLDEINDVFKELPAASLRELEEKTSGPKRKRGGQ